jgi:RNA polymerase sigma-70 factor (ECF subfamily)
MYPPDQTDAELVARIVEGDQGALAALYDRHATRAFGTAFRIIGDRGAAEEVVQETMLVLWDRAELIDPAVGSLAGWVTTIARNKAIDRLRADGRRPQARPLSGYTMIHGDVDTDAAERVIENGELLAASERPPDPADAADAAWVRRTINAALANLPDVERQVIELAYAGNLSQSEIADELGWPLGTVKTRTRRALASLRAALGPVLNRDPDDLGPGYEEPIEGPLDFPFALALAGAADPEGVPAA